MLSTHAFFGIGEAGIVPSLTPPAAGLCLTARRNAWVAIANPHAPCTGTLALTTPKRRTTLSPPHVLLRLLAFGRQTSTHSCRPPQWGRHENSHTDTLAPTLAPKRGATLICLVCSRTPSSSAHVLTLAANVLTGKGIEPQTLAPCGRTVYHQAAACGLHVGSCLSIVMLRA